jgi:hypothetical protein
VKVRTTSHFGGPGLLTSHRDSVWFTPSRITATVDDAPWSVTLVLDLGDDGHHHLADVRLTSKPGGPPIAVEMIRRVRLGAAVDEALRQATTEVDVEGEGLAVTFEKGSTWQAAPAEMATVLRKRGLKVPAGEVEAAADLYRNAPSDGLQAVADGLHISRATAARRIKLARQRGLLPERGR